MTKRKTLGFLTTWHNAIPTWVGKGWFSVAILVPFLLVLLSVELFVVCVILALLNVQQAWMVYVVSFPIIAVNSWLVVVLNARLRGEA